MLLPRCRVFSRQADDRVEEEEEAFRFISKKFYIGSQALHENRVSERITMWDSCKTIKRFRTFFH